MSTPESTTPVHDCACWSRREAFRAAGTAGVVLAGAGTLAACGASDEVSDAAPSAGGAASSAAAGAADAIKAADVPVGGGMVIESLEAVVTQPTEGEYKAFSSVCTHSGCTVGGVENGVISCPCHGSQFDIATGAVVQGPASKPLPEKSVTVDGEGLSVT